MASRIIEGLYVGDTADAHRIYENHLADVIINVLERPRPDERTPHEIWIPFLQEHHGHVGVRRKQLKNVAKIIDENLQQGKIVLLRCGQGKHRSPFAAMYFLHTRRGLSWEDAYALVKQKRPETSDALRWAKI